MNATDWKEDMYDTADENASNSGLDYYNIEHRLHMMMRAPQDMIALVLGTVSITLNVIILLSLYQVQNRLTTHCRLIISLAVSDMLVGTSVLLFKVNKAFNPQYDEGEGPYFARTVAKCAAVIIKALTNSGLIATLLNLMMMACDHYFAIMKPLHYPLVMTKSKVVCVVLALWTVALLLGFSDFFSPYNQHHYSDMTFCELVYITMYQEEFAIYVIAPLCLGVMVILYSRIYIKVLRRRPPGSGTAQQRSTKALVTTLLNICSFVLAWLPVCLLEVSLIIIAHTNPHYLNVHQGRFVMITQHLYNLLILNAIADPIIYTVRMQEVRIGFWRLCNRCCCFKYSRHLALVPTSSTQHSVVLKRQSPTSNHTVLLQRANSALAQPGMTLEEDIMMKSCSQLQAAL